jgi:Rod binding domain-containing protein
LDVLVSHGVGVVSTLSVLDSMIPGHGAVDNGTLDSMLPQSREAYLQNVEQISKQNSTLFGQVMIKQMEWERSFVAKGGLLMSGADPTVSSILLSVLSLKLIVSFNVVK